MPPQQDKQEQEVAETPLDLRPCEHQAGGHFKSGKSGAAGAGTFVDGTGRFYKAFQDDSRGIREAQLYESIFGQKVEPGTRTEDLVELRQFVPTYYGMVTNGNVKLLALEDSCHGYKKPCVLDAKMGFSTIYDWADDTYKEKNKNKDVETTQASCGWRVTGFKVFEQPKGEYFFANRLYGRSITPATMPDSLAHFATNGSLTPKDIYGGPKGAIAQIRRLHEWFERQRSLLFFAASVIIMYEGEAKTPEEADVRVKWIDFAHTFPADGKKDENVGPAVGLLVEMLEQVVAKDEARS